jgi:hypothetical protein
MQTPTPTTQTPNTHTSGQAPDTNVSRTQRRGPESLGTAAPSGHVPSIEPSGTPALSCHAPSVETSRTQMLTSQAASTQALGSQALGAEVPRSQALGTRALSSHVPAIPPSSIETPSTEAPGIAMSTSQALGSQAPSTDALGAEVSRGQASAAEVLRGQASAAEVLDSQAPGTEAPGTASLTNLPLAGRDGELRRVHGRAPGAQALGTQALEAEVLRGQAPGAGRPNTQAPGGEVPANPASSVQASGPKEGADSAPRSGGLRLARPIVRTFPRRAKVEPPPPEWQRFMADFCAAYDLDFDLARYTNGDGHSFAEMAQALLADLDQPLPELDAVLLAHHVPDTKVFEIAGCHLTELCPGDPVAFSVSGQGIGAPFTALRILTSMRQTDDLREGAVFILDQSSLPYKDPDTPDHGNPIPHNGAAQARHNPDVRDSHSGAVRDSHDGALEDSSPGAPQDRAVLLCTDPAGAILDFVDDTPVTDPTSALETLHQHFPDARIVVGRNLANHTLAANRGSTASRVRADHAPELGREPAGDGRGLGREPADVGRGLGRELAGDGRGLGREPADVGRGLGQGLADVGLGREPADVGRGLGQGLADVGLGREPAGDGRGLGQGLADERPGLGLTAPSRRSADVGPGLGRGLADRGAEVGRGLADRGLADRVSELQLADRAPEFRPPRARLLLRNDPDPRQSSENPRSTRAKGPFARTSLAPDPKSGVLEPESGVIDGPSHQLCTSVWAALAEYWPLDRYTIVADYDPHTSRLFQAGLRPGTPS